MSILLSVAKSLSSNKVFLNSSDCQSSHGADMNLPVIPSESSDKRNAVKSAAFVR